MSHGHWLLQRSKGAASIRRSVNQAIDAWNTFWFAPADPLMLGIIRLLGGWMLFYNLLIWTLDLEAFFGNHGLQPLEAIRSLHEGRFIFSFWLWTGDAYLWPMHFVCLAIAGMFCLGIATRVTSVLSFLITISYSQRVPIANFGFDQILGMLCLYLSIGPSGAAVSVDAWVRRWWLRRKGIQESVRKFSSARIAMRLIQLHLCAIYFWAGFAKLKGPTWWTGEAMWRVLANQEYQTMDLTWMAWVPWLPFLIAHITITWEVFFIALIWNARLRPFMLAMGVAMHVGIGAFLGMWTFGLIMAFAYLAFSDPDVWRSRLQWFSARQSRQSESSKTQRLVSHDIARFAEETPRPSLFQPDPELERDVNESHAAILKLSVTQADAPPFIGLTESDESAESAQNDRDLAECSPSGRCENSRELCIVAAVSSDRSALRRYFRDHQMTCRAVSDFENGLNVLSRMPFSAISAVVVNGTQFSPSDMIDFVSDVVDLINCPVLVLLTPQQTMAVEELECLQSVHCLAMPVSLRTIRMKLQNLTEGDDH
jgi:hypothetical protein